jgi:WXG100 family type VII secretion target
MDDILTANHLVRFGSDIKKYQDYVRQLKTTSNKLFSELESLNSSWSGPAHSSYVDNLKEDQELMDSVFKALSSISGEFEHANKTYKACEERVREEIASLVV